MQYFETVHVLDCPQNLSHDEFDAVFREGVSIDEIQQVSAITELGDHIVVFLIFKNLVKFDDVGMIQFLEYLELVNEA